MAGIPAAYLVGAGRSEDSEGTFGPSLGPLLGVEGQGPPEASVRLERPRREEGQGRQPELRSLTRPLSSGHPAEAERQVPEQGVEEEVCDAL